MPDNEEVDVEALFMQDAIRRAHDEELAALASLALIRSGMNERDQMLAYFEREQVLNPREVRRQLQKAQEEQTKSTPDASGKKPPI